VGQFWRAPKQLILLLAKDSFRRADADLKKNIIEFYDVPTKPQTVRDPVVWDKVTKALAVLRTH